MGELSIKVTIASRNYPLVINRNEEESVRRAAKMIEQSVNELKENYAVKDYQDLLAMTALQYATEVVKGRKGTIEDDELAEKLAGLDERLGSYLERV